MRPVFARKTVLDTRIRKIVSRSKRRRNKEFKQWILRRKVVKDGNLPDHIQVRHGHFSVGESAVKVGAGFEVAGWLAE